MKLYEALEKQLKTENNFVSDSGELKKWVVINKAQNYDADLISLLLDDKELKEKFFIDVKGTLVFNQNLFVQFLEQKNYLNDSYTQFKNKVGLTIDGKYLKQRNEVALVWPFKDCVLEGGQSREEDKREEIFFNETLAQDEITQLLEPKVLTNAKTYDKNGEKDFSSFTRDAELNKKRGLPEDTITDNLIIKGNNLLALHSLKKEFAGKIKLIYIDPPYNTGFDFGYNDKFNHSTWLTFMKNRLQIAKNLLTNDGTIWINIGDDEVHYLKILADDVFGRESFLANIIWEKSDSPKMDALTFSSRHDHLLVFAKNANQITIKKISNNVENLKHYNKKEENGRVYYLKPLRAMGKNGTREKRPTMYYPIIAPDKSEIYPKNKDGSDSCWRWSKKRLEKDFERVVINKTSSGWSVNFKIYADENSSKPPETIWFNNEVGSNRTSKKEIKNLFSDEIVFETPKPENLLKRILNVSTNENDIVLDFFAGSGTTASVSHKMKRKFIAIEQMDYVNTVTSERLKKVIAGEQGGISKDIKWQGGGSFLFFELKKYNQTLIDKIEKAKNIKGLLAIWEQMKVKSFLNYNVDIKKQDEHIEDFKKLELKEQKEHLVILLDKNQLYVNLSSLNDKDFKCSKDEKQLTQDFYQIKKD